MTSETRLEIDSEMASFLKEMDEKMEKDKQLFEEYSQKDAQQKEQNRLKAENERNKGNECVKSKDYNEALTFYTKSIHFDKTMKQSYGNRALIYLRERKFKECVEDCNRAIELDTEYSKAYHRRGKAYLEMGLAERARRDL